MAKKHGPNKENLEATRRVFLGIARHEFSTLGYYNASTARIVEESGMARGSLYYHFGDKKGLFRAVYEELMIEMSATIHAKVAPIQNSWDAYIAGCLCVLDLCTKQETRRIVIDVHTALTYQERLEILNRSLLLELTIILTRVLEDGYFKGHEVKTLSLLVFGMISENARGFELAEDVQAARTTVGNAFVMLMEKARG